MSAKRFDKIISHQKLKLSSVVYGNMISKRIELDSKILKDKQRKTNAQYQSDDDIQTPTDVDIIQNFLSDHLTTKNRQEKKKFWLISNDNSNFNRIAIGKTQNQQELQPQQINKAGKPAESIFKRLNTPKKQQKAINEPKPEVVTMVSKEQKQGKQIVNLKLKKIQINKNRKLNIQLNTQRDKFDANNIKSDKYHATNLKLPFINPLTKSMGDLWQARQKEHSEYTIPTNISNSPYYDKSLQNTSRKLGDLKVSKKIQQNV